MLERKKNGEKSFVSKIDNSRMGILQKLQLFAVRNTSRGMGFYFRAHVKSSRAAHELTPAVALFVLLLLLAVTDLRLACSSTSDAAMKSFLVGPVDPWLPPPMADWTISPPCSPLLRVRLLRSLRFPRRLRGRRRRRRHAALRVDTEHLLLRPPRRCRHCRRSARARSPSLLRSPAESLTPPHAVPLNALVSVTLSPKMQARKWS